LAVDAFVLLIGPEVLELDFLESNFFEALDVGEYTFSVIIRAVLVAESHGVRNDAERLGGRELRARPERIGDLLLEAIGFFEHVFQADKAAVSVGGFDLEHGREDVPLGLVADVGTGLGGFCVLAGG
jgi:hypothetical protein